MFIFKNENLRFVKFFVFTLYLLAALNISSYKTELQNNRVLTV